MKRKFWLAMALSLLLPLSAWAAGLPMMNSTPTAGAGKTTRSACKCCYS